MYGELYNTTPFPILFRKSLLYSRIFNITLNVQVRKSVKESQTEDEGFIEKSKNHWIKVSNSSYRYIKIQILYFNVFFIKISSIFYLKEHYF